MKVELLSLMSAYWRCGWLQDIRHCPSPNFNERPSNADVSLLVIHNISLPPGQFDNCYVEDFFRNQLDCSIHPYFEEIAELQVSAHFLIKRDGEIVQFVSCDDRAWHAGESCFEGAGNCNDFSIGIELQGADDVPYESIQYQQLACLCQVLMVRYPKINPERITGHCDIAPGRKTDPGAAFDWFRFKQKLAES